MNPRTLPLDKKLERALQSGHPWLYRNHLPARHGLKHGDWVRLQAGKGRAVGLYDDHGQIAVRLFAADEVPGRALIARRVNDALDLRDMTVANRDTNAYRLVYGEGDYLPGITVDRYERYAVLQLYGSSLEALVPEVLHALTHRLSLRGVLQRRSGELEAIWGQRPPPEVTVSENGIKLIANLYEGQKTGLFLDHRDNRATLQLLCKDKRVLNLFSYTGAFSLYALAGGAAEVTSVDTASAATEDARRNFAINGYDPDAHHFLTADAFGLLDEWAAQGKQFDVVVLDPPSLARNKESRFAALRAYRKLNTQAARCVVPGGLLATASCTAQVSPTDFRELLGEAGAAAGRRLQIIHEAGHAPDHPVPAAFPEGRYLKFIVARVLEG
ncbi:MAG TPA: class I SAM-dependent rRNA methyltransferase [Trueperaceae bacterium]